MRKLYFEIEDSVLKEMKSMLSKLRKPESSYINEAIQFYHYVQKRELLSKQLTKESKLVREESIKILADVECLH
jgi:hypothetical protein